MRKKWPSWPAHWLGLLAVSACTLMTACAGVSSGGQSNANPGGGSGNGTGQLSVTPATMNFGTVAVGTPATLTGTLTAGTADVNVSSAAWTGEGYNVTGITFPTTVAAGKSVTYTVTFTPQASGTSSGSISFVNDGATSPVTETLDGSGGQAGIHSVALNWDASSTSSVIGYNVYRGTQSGGPYQLITTSPQATTSFTDTTVLTGTTYYYVATSVDSDHVESVFSNQAQAVVP
jgi:Abnormal spindle-like microcephaly-assoc'd, ASPM-SPD-2-Hydin